MSFLIITLPDGRTSKHVLGDDVAVMGRDPSCDILLDDPSASRRHALMRFKESRYFLEDLGSKNGTLVNDRRIDERPLNHLDHILVGSVELKFIDDDAITHRPSTVAVTDQITYEPSYVSRSASFNLNAQRLEMLYELSDRLTKLREPNALLEDALDICFQMLRFERGAIAVRKTGGRGVDWPVIRNLGPTGGELKISQSVLGRALDHGERSILTDTAGQSVDPTVSMVQHGICSAMCVPLKNEDEVLGVIYGDRTTTGTQYSGEDVDFFAAIARQVTIGLVNAKLMDEQRTMAVLEKDLALAREIQEKLLPDEIPERDGVTFAALNDPGRLVSGDYYDIVDIGDGRFGFVIADVTGKGVAASLLMSNLQAAVRMSLPGCTDLGRTVKKWNDLIHANTDATRFVTCLVAILDPKNRSLTYVTAGHYLPYLLYADGKPPRTVEAEPDFPLGVIPNADYAVHTTELGTNPCVVFVYTDGVNEAMNNQDEEFGNDRIQAVLEANDTLDPRATIRKMRKTLAAHCRDVPQSDDITMVAVHLA